MKNRILLTIGVISFTGLAWASGMNYIPVFSAVLILPISVILGIWADW